MQKTHNEKAHTPVIEPDIAQTGWQFHPGPAPITRYQVFGERSSGTNFVKRLIGRNTGLRPIEDLGWKHGFYQMTAVPEDVAVIVVVRDARKWALSMHAKPWHCPPAMQAMTFEAFAAAPWETIADRARYFPQVQALGGLGQPLQHDRHPLTGAAFGSLFDLRRTKLAGHLSITSRGCAAAIVQLEAVQAAPEAFLAALAKGLRAPAPHAEYRPVVKRLGSKFKPSVETRPATPDRFPEGLLPHLREQLDLDLESRLGYRY